MPYTAKQQLDLIKANKLEIIDKINELLGEDSGLTWDSSWPQFIAKINEIKTTLPIENDQLITEIEHFIANQGINSIAIASDKIKDSAFRQKTSLLAIDAPNVEQIEQYAFYSATGLVSISAPNCAVVGEQAFRDTSNLQQAILSNNCTLNSRCFYNSTKLKSISTNSTLDIPTYAFYNCYNLEIDSSIFTNASTIKDYAFYNCDKLRSFDFSNTTYIYDYAFYDCDGLQTIDLSNKTKRVYNYAFEYCRNLKQVIIPESTTQIDYMAFYYLHSDCEIWCEAEQKPGNWHTSWTDCNKVYWNAKLRDYIFFLNNGESSIIKTLRGVKLSDLPVITKEGYAFDNWYTDSEFTHKAKLPYISADNTQLFARWIRGYTVILVDYETLEQTNIGMHYYNTLSDIETNFFDGGVAYTAVGVYSDSSCTNLVTDLDIEHLPTPTIYIKATLAPSYSEVKNFECTNTAVELNLAPGKHTIECWGASGGQRSGNTTSSACRGGYSKGVLTLGTQTRAFVYAGGEGLGTSTFCAGGFNGGGQGQSTQGRITTSGGGASDVRLLSDSLYTRVIVAGGGGGGHDSSSTPNGAACGGGLHGTGGYSSSHINYNQNTDRCGAPGTQTNGGLGRTSTNWGTSASVNGAFGQGGYFNNSQYSTGGGGGWYGGGAGGPDGAAGGGSGYVYTVDSAADYPSGCQLNSNYYLSEAVTLGGLDTFTSPENQVEIGHSGNGYVRISSAISGSNNPPKCTINLIGIKENNEQINLTSIELLHNIYSNTLPNKFLDWTIDTWYTDLARTVEITYPYEIILNGTINLYTNVTERPDYVFEYTGNVVELSLTPGVYKLECWGAQGGDGIDPNVQVSNKCAGGKGGYSVGTLTLNETVPIYIYCGGKGKTSIVKETRADGGFNGGGNTGTSGTYDYSRIVGGGGGGSDIRIGTDSLYARVIVAGGGGGSIGSNTSHGGQTTATQAPRAYYSNQGGYGGGLTGQSGGSWCCIGGNGATQTGCTPCTNHCSNGTYMSAGTFGNGSDSIYNIYQTGSGAGGGWYGGQAGGTGCGHACGGGGSGYVYTADTAMNYPAGCLLNANYYLTDASTIAGDQTFDDPYGVSEVGHSGNGCVKITKIRSN